METKEISPVQNAMRWGLYTGLVLVALAIIFYMTNIGPNTGWQYVTYLIVISGIFWGTKVHRDTELDGYMSYGRGLGSGVLIALFSAIILSVYTFISLQFIDPSQMAKALEVAEQDMVNKGLSDQQIEMSMEMARKFSNPPFISLMIIISYTFFGFIFSLLTSALLKKNKPMFDKV